MIKKIQLCTINLLTIFSLSIIAGCSSSIDQTPYSTAPNDFDTTLVNAGHDAAIKAISFPPGSREREESILAIRASEERLRQAGMHRSADSYSAGADSILSNLKSESDI